MKYLIPLIAAIYFLPLAAKAEGQTIPKFTRIDVEITLPDNEEKKYSYVSDQYLNGVELKTNSKHFKCLMIGEESDGSLTTVTVGCFDPKKPDTSVNHVLICGTSTPILTKLFEPAKKNKRDRVSILVQCK